MKRIGYIALMSVSLCLSPLLFAQDAAPAPVQPPADAAAAPAPSDITPVKVVDPKVAEMLDKLATFYSGLKGFSIEATETADLPTPENTIKQSKTTYQISFARPGSLKTSWQNDDQQILVVSDGTTLYIYLPTEKEYRKIDPPSSIMQLVHGAATGPGHPGGQLFAHFVAERPFDRWAQGFDKVTMGEIEEDGAKLTNMVFLTESPQGSEQVELFIKQGEQPVVSRMKVTAAGADARKIELKLDVTWKFNPEFAENEFKFEVPEGAKEATPPEKEKGGAEEKYPAEDMVGKPAPDCTLNLMDGTQVKLSDLKGKNVVILDLWATWCAPCRKMLPSVTKLAEDYKDKGVLLFAVNLGDSKDEVAKFLETAKIAPVVALDPEGKVGELYKVQPIPQTVIIGKDGIIKSVKIGGGDDVEAELKRNIEEALGAVPAAEPVAAATPAPAPSPEPGK
jgi:thiol-disulfide isomerase/thioredoxin/outer membrane lipoprotein-sorting protein